MTPYISSLASAVEEQKEVIEIGIIYYEKEINLRKR